MKELLLKTSFLCKGLLVLTIFVLGSATSAQTLYIGANSEFYLDDGLEFTTSNTLVEVEDAGLFSVSSGNSWGSAQEYVNGTVKVIGTGQSVLPVGDNGIYAPVNLDHTGDATARYYNSSPTAGSNGVNVDDVAEVEYWELTGTAVVTLPYNSNSEIGSLVSDNGGVLNAVSLVGLNGGVWDLISATNTSVVNGDVDNGTVSSDLSVASDLSTFSQFTFGIDHQIVLGLNDLFLQNGISLLANPVPTDDPNITFQAASEMDGLNVSIYDINGRVVRQYDAVDLNFGQGSLGKSNLKSGLYFIRFEHEGKQGVKKILIE